MDVSSRAPREGLSHVVGASEPPLSERTIGAWLDRYPDFPVLQNGTNGREYAFDPFAVRAFMREQEAIEDALEAKKAEAIAQIGLPLEESANDQAGLLTPKNRLDHIRAIAAEDKLRIERGYLVSVPATRMAMSTAIARWNRAIHARIRQEGRDLNLPNAVVRALLAGVAETQRQFVRELGYDAEPSTENERNLA